MTTESVTLAHLNLKTRYIANYEYCRHILRILSNIFNLFLSKT